MKNHEYPSMAFRAEQYLTARRALGLQLKIEGQQLLKFAQYADHLGDYGPLTIELAVSWARSSKRGGPVGWARRLEVIRPFAKYLFAFEPDTKIPPPGLLGPAHHRTAPYIYSEQQVLDLLDTTTEFRPKDSLRPKTFHTLFALLACTGIRPAEGYTIKNENVDLQNGLLTIRNTKFRKSRIVPLHPSAMSALRDYIRVRDQHISKPNSDAFFLVDGGFPLTKTKVRTAFDRARIRLRWNKLPTHRAPRLYDLRHTFVCRCFLRWYKEGKDVDKKISALSTYLGHVKVSDTYWYLTAIPELMSQTSQRFEKFVLNSNLPGGTK